MTSMTSSQTTLSNDIPQRHCVWNDDDRVNDYISYHYDQKEDYIPVYKLLKEMYDEDKKNLYIYDAEEEYRYIYGECYYEKYQTNYYEMLSDYYEIYSVSSVVDSEEDDAGMSDVDWDICPKIPEDVNEVVEDDVKNKRTDEEIVSLNSNKFIYI